MYFLEKTCSVKSMSAIFLAVPRRRAAIPVNRHFPNLSFTIWIKESAYIIAEATGTDENRNCCPAVSGLCKRQAESRNAQANSFLALTLAEFPKAQEAKRRFPESLSDSPADPRLREVFGEVAREMSVRKIHPEEVHNPRVKRQ